MGEKLVIFALDSKLDRVTETLVSTSVSKFLWLYILISSFDFGIKQKLYPKILTYSRIWPFLENHTLKLQECKIL